MTELSQQMLVQVSQGPVRRHRIADAFGIKRGVSATLRRHARELDPPHVVERRRKGRKYEVEYQLRPALPGEEPGQIHEIIEEPRPNR